MYICYFDETGDDGYPQYSSELFVLTSVYGHYQDWKKNYEKIHNFKKELKNKYNLPVKIELHLKPFLTDKKPYREYGLSECIRKEMIYSFFDLICTLNIKIINVVINKKNIKKDNYDVLDNALNYNIQRIENDLKSKSPEHKFMIITDEGRVQKMAKTTRKVQRINFIQSKYNTESYRQEIENLIEDPLPKKSSESYFNQIANSIS